MSQLRFMLYITGIGLAAQSALFLIFMHPELSWKPLHYFLDWFFAVAFMLPLSLILPRDCCNGIVSAAMLYLYHLPLMTVYALIFAGLVSGGRWILQSTINRKADRD